MYHSNTNILYTVVYESGS